MIKNKISTTKEDIESNYSTDDSDTEERIKFLYDKKEDEEVKGNFSFLKKSNKKIKQVLKPEEYINE